MFKSTNLLLKACVYTCVLFAASSCKDTDEFFQEKDSGNHIEEANSFDFSTTRSVDLFVDYSAYPVCGPVLFSIYSENPIVDENSDVEYVDESIKPIYQGYTNAQGKFDANVTLPAYAKVLHIVTGNFMIGLKRVMVEVKNGEAKAVVKDGVANAPRRTNRLKAEGEWTNDFSPLYNFAYRINTSTGAKTNELIYKEWVTPLGQWNTASGRINYLIDPATANPELLFTEDVVKGMYQTVCDALNSGTTCKESYRSSADLTLIKDSEVSICAIGSRTCWNNSLAYYYYNEDNKPNSPLDLNPIMLFPNTQDGKRYDNCDYNGSIGMDRGDVIQLIYYPNIANGDLDTKSTVFPKGTKIGFLLKSNGWGCIDQDHSFNYSGWKTKKMNIWGASTDGLSFCGDKGYNIPNPEGAARTAKFAYTAKDGSKYALVSFEDACDDTDYDDLVFALNPSNVFAGLAEVEKGKTTISGVYAFEDLWPNRGDYDMNDVLVDCKHEKHFTNGNINKEIYRLTTYQNIVGKVSGLAVRLATQVTPSSIVMKKIAPGNTQETVVTFTKDDLENNVYYLTNDVTGELNSTYIFELTYATAVADNKLASIEPFLYRDEEGKRWEVHLPYMNPTKKMDMSYFGTLDDASDPSKGEWYVRRGFYPFAFYLAGPSADNFKETILLRKNENRPISDFYPGFIPWATSKGETNEDWYLHPAN